jgi:hypothetical protein
VWLKYSRSLDSSYRPPIVAIVAEIGSTWSRVGCDPVNGAYGDPVARLAAHSRTSSASHTRG